MYSNVRYDKISLSPLSPHCLFQVLALLVPGQFKLVVSVVGVSPLSNDVVLLVGRVGECAAVCCLASFTLVSGIVTMVG